MGSRLLLVVKVNLMNEKAYPSENRMPVSIRWTGLLTVASMCYKNFSSSCCSLQIMYVPLLVMVF